jgi:hypothetical protein
LTFRCWGAWMRAVMVFATGGRRVQAARGSDFHIQRRCALQVRTGAGAGTPVANVMRPVCWPREP